MPKPVRLAEMTLVAAASATLIACSSNPPAGSGPTRSGTVSRTATSSVGTGDSGRRQPGAAPVSSGLGQGFGGSTLDVAKYCAAIKPADIQALEKVAVGVAVSNPEECDFVLGAITISIYPNDTDLAQYKQAFGTVTPMNGIGDKAGWFQVTPGSAPELLAHAGTTTCDLSPDSDVTKTTLPYTGIAPFDKVTSSDVLAYAQKEGAVCTDIFTAAS